MSEWLNYVKDYATKHNISYKQALKDASSSYKTRNEKKPEEIKKEQPTKLKRNSNKKVVENITLKL
jgi:mRNA-degrading endonuclease HigB of HigAB toxin-antitoxin module